MRRVGWAVLVIAILGCAMMREQFTDVTQLAATLQEHYKQPVGVNITNGSYLTLSVSTDTTDKLTDDARRALAFDIAKFAYAHYNHPATVRQVSVRFVVNQTYGAVNFTRTAVAGSWSPSDLRGP